MTRIAPLADVKARLSAYIEESQTEGPVVITRNGRAVAVLVSPVDDDDVESLVLARSRRPKTSQKVTGKYRGRRRALRQRILERRIKAAPPRCSIKSLPNCCNAEHNSNQPRASYS
jgi:prevent-host-death family protein